MAAHTCGTPGGCALPAARCAASRPTRRVIDVTVWSTSTLTGADAKAIAREDQLAQLQAGAR